MLLMPGGSALAELEVNARLKVGLAKPSEEKGITDLPRHYPLQLSEPAEEHGLCRPLPAALGNP
jgi:hypothetical protein